MDKVKVLEFGNLLAAWEGVNEYLFLECEEVAKRGGGAYGPEWVSYRNYVIANRAWVDPKFNLGKVLGYTIKKWSSLINNYVDFKYLDLLRGELGYRVGREARSYNYSYHFSNHHGAGKDCLISLNFTKQIGIPQPIVIFNVRTSEVTKRLIFDFILVQRVVEYVYGHNDVEVHLFAPSFYITAESFVMYNNVKKLKGLLKDHRIKHKKEYRESNHKFQDKVIKKFDEYMNHPSPETIRYKVHRRSVMQIQRAPDGGPRSGTKDLFVSQLLLKRTVEELPKNAVTPKQIKAHNNGVSVSKHSDSKG